MKGNASYPLYGLFKDDGTMFLIENPDEVLGDIEPAYFAKNEYLFWDAQGRGVLLILERDEPPKIEDTQNEITLREAFSMYSRELGASVDTAGSFAEVWLRLQGAIKPKTKLRRVVEGSIGFGCLSAIIVWIMFALAGLGIAIRSALTR